MTVDRPRLEPIGRTNGEPVLITATSSAAPQKVHTVRDLTQGWDRVSLYVATSVNSTQQLYWRISGNSSGTFMRVDVPGSSDALLVFSRIPLRGGVTIECYASTGSQLAVFGEVLENVVEEDEDA